MDMTVQTASLADCLPGMAYRCQYDAGWTLAEVSAGAQALTGLGADALLQQYTTLDDLIHPNDWQRVREERQAGLAKSGEFSIEYRIITPFDSVKYVQDQGRAIVENGHIVAVAGLISDATLRIKHQKQHRRAEKAIISAALSPHLAAGDIKPFCREITRLVQKTLKLDQAGVWLFNGNHDELELVCLAQKDRVDCVSGTILHARDFPDYFAALMSARVIDASDAYGDKRTAEFVRAYLPSTGVVSMLDATIRLGGEVIGVLCCEQKYTLRYWDDEDSAFASQIADQFSQAVSNHRRIEAEHKALEAETRSLAKSQFLASMSHEIRTPMNGVLGMTELLHMTPLNTEQKNYLAVIEESGSLLLNIIDEILDFSKLEAGKVELHETPSAIRRLFSGVVDLLSSSAAADVRIRLDIDDNLPDLLLVDNHRLRQILLNLLGNAVKFTDHGTIGVSAKKIDATHWSFTVADTGIGIDEKMLARLFEPFERGLCSQHVMGTGLGLAISCRLAELMGGTIEVDSKQGVGSTFTMVLPLQVVNEEKSLVGNAAKPLYQGFEKLNVLVAEDNLINQKVIQGLLRQFGINPDICCNGVEAVDRFSKEGDKYDLILMDCEMPDMDGFTATEEIRRISRFKAPTIAALTAHALPEHRERSRACGMNYYLTKPVKLDDLRQLLANVY